ncbi:hypothetical protein MNBD_PLANCTO02-1470 [hydrothermal vent metagenome]|uniref:Peptidase M28 domain-containing protein n=1 Tax=hydrothermal vent metagenome TaxID=652676 RepID=A0A3B1E6P9_9ZZZZ
MKKNRLALLSLFCLTTACTSFVTVVCASKPAAISQIKPPRNQWKKGEGKSISVKEIKPHIEYLASKELRGRSGESAKVAAKYLVGHFKKWNLQPLFADGSYYQKLSRKKEDGTTVVIGRNVGCWLKGSDPQLCKEFIIISAHYDHLGVIDGRIYRGADDNASGVSMMLEVAHKFSKAKVKPKRSLVFIGFDLEEEMLWGSRWFAAHPPWELNRVKLFITADMIGRSLGGLPIETLFVLGSEHSPLLKKQMDKVGTPDGLEVARLGIDLVGSRSDFAPFRDRKIPFLFFSSGIHPDYHSPGDIPEKIKYTRVAKTSELVFRLSAHVANAKNTPQWQEVNQPDIDEARALYRISTLLLQSQRGKTLTDPQRFVVSQTQLKAKQIIERGKMTSSERKWLARLSQFMLISIF